MHAPAGLPPFPVRAGGCATPDALAARGLRLRHANAGDLAWLPALYADTRRDEMTAVPWPAAAKAAFLAEQFALQHRHYMAHYADADFLAIESGAAPVGRFYLHHGADDDLIVDISLFADQRGHGIGAALIAAMQADAARAGRGMTLSVLTHNVAAQRLYTRLGFSATQVAGMHQGMRWSPSRAAAARSVS
jgi:ribosomal protein S18 acetylase RimI-like enzyme